MPLLNYPFKTMLISSLLSKGKDCAKRLSQVFNQEIWDNAFTKTTGIKAKLYALLRISSITSRELSKNKIASHAAALGYYSLIALGPVVAMAVMISGFVLKKADNNLANDTVNRLITFVNPPANEFIKMEEGEGIQKNAPSVNPQLVKVINHMVESARSGTVGIVGSLMLMLISIQLITIIEKTFNGIWKVRKGRSWIQRLFFYWTILSLGAVLMFTVAAFLSAATLSHLFGKLPFASHFQFLSSGFPHLISFTIMTFCLGLFYRYIPNTRVKWKPAVIGAVLVTILLLLNNYASFFYVSQVIRQRSLYGSIGIMPVLMFGLYVLWYFILFGSQVAYAVQYSNEAPNAKNKLSIRSQKMLYLVLFLLIARRFANCTPPLSITELQKILPLPASLIKTALSHMHEIKLLYPLVMKRTTCYQPAKPLDKITLNELNQSIEYAGGVPEIFSTKDFLIDLPTNLSQLLDKKSLGEKTIAELIQI